MLTLFVPKGGKGQRCNSILDLLKQFANTQTYQVEVVVEIQHQILITKLPGNVQQMEGRVDNQIWELKG